MQTTTDVYTEVQQFYARHFHLLDAGRAAEWAETFTVDGWFWPRTLPEPVRGRAALTAGVRRTHERLAEAGEQHRHWHGMVDVRPRDDGDLDVRCYALIYVIPRGEAPRLHLSCVCTDRLTREDGEWKVAERRVTRDDLHPETVGAPR